MHLTRAFRRRNTITAAALLTTVLLISSCSPEPEPTDTAPTGLPGSHIHGMSVDTENQRILLATHDGLYGVKGHAVEKIGPTIDLMGFTASEGSSQFYASGHPGPGSQLPNPMGLIESTDNGRSWAELSRQGTSDFHALTQTAQGILGYDGSLRRSHNGKTWETVPVDFQPFNLAGSTDTAVVLATTESGLQRSTDGGASWQPVSGSPLLMLTVITDGERAVGVSPDGSVSVSSDAGATWERTGSVGAPPVALTATDTDGRLEIWVATDSSILHSTDGGSTFTTIAGEPGEL